MFALLATLTLVDSALADTITLETGVTIEGDLARYEMGGDCQVSVTEGDLQGVIVIVPCHRIAAFVRDARPAPVVVSVIEPALAVPVNEESIDVRSDTTDPFDAAEQAMAALPAEMPVVESSDDPPYGTDGDGDDLGDDESDDLNAYDADGDDAIVQPRAAPSMPTVPSPTAPSPGVTKRSISF